MASRLTIRSANAAEIDVPGIIKPSICRVGLLDGRIVTYVLAEQKALQYGSTRLRVMRVNRVFTEVAFRRRGYAAAIVHDALATMMEQGAHLALLYDIPGYFGRFGFSPVWPTYWLKFPSADAARLSTPMTLRAPTTGDLPQLIALYERHWTDAGRVTFIRTPETWLNRLQHDADRQIIIAVDDKQRVAGYITGYDLLDESIEILVDSPDAALSFVAEAGRLYQSAGRAAVRWHVPPDDLIIAFLRPHLNITLSAAYHANGGWTARIIDAAGLVEALLPEITSQAQSVLPGFNAGNLVLECQPDVVLIGMRGQKTSFCRLRHRDFIQVMFATLHPAALGVRENLHPDSVNLLVALFPPRMAVLGHWDWF